MKTFLTLQCTENNHLVRFNGTSVMIPPRHEIEADKVARDAGLAHHGNGCIHVVFVDWHENGQVVAVSAGAFQKVGKIQTRHFAWRKELVECASDLAENHPAGEIDAHVKRILVDVDAAGFGGRRGFGLELLQNTKSLFARLDVALLFVQVRFVGRCAVQAAASNSRSTASSHRHVDIRLSEQPK